MSDEDLEGSEELKELEELEEEIENLTDTQEMALLEDILNPEFMKEHTSYDDLETFLASGDFDSLSRKGPLTEERLESIPDEELDQYVREKTDFEDWDEMVKEATDDALEE